MQMNRKAFLVMILVGALGLGSVAAARDHDGGEGGGGHAGGNGGSVRQQAPAQAAPARSQRQALVINMGHGSSGGYGRNYPSQQNYQSRPSWGHVQRPVAPAQSARVQAWHGNAVQAQPQRMGRGEVNAYAGQGQRAAQAVHHHAYSPGYVRQKLQRLGVKAEPAYITDRAEIVHTDRAHSSIRLPGLGLGGALLKAALIGPRGVTAALIGSHMARISNGEWMGRVEGFNRDEARAGRYYWHQGDGFNYCHYLDGSGYHWYGWYLGDQCFWTRNFNGRWWWYDDAQDRWSFYNDGFWWWQDPYHVGELYCYNDGSYIPVNSAADQIVVTQPDSPSGMKAFNSPDGARTVKLVAGSDDAFLYDAAADPSFSPVYLASGVQSVEFSNPANGRPLEIILRLNDGSFDLFDSLGRPYGPAQTADPSDGQDDAVVPVQQP